MEEPMRKQSNTDMAEPIWLRPQIEIAEPSRAKLRKDNEEPNRIKSRIDRAEPILETPNKDIALPSRT